MCKTMYIRNLRKANIKVGVILLFSFLFAFTGNVLPSPLPSGTKSGAIEDARSLLLNEDFNAAIVEYGRLVSEDTANSALNSEFAYALALGGIYDAALSQLDRTRAFVAVTAETEFFSAEVLGLMGFEGLASEFRAYFVKGNTPAWISSKAPEFHDRYRRTTIIAPSGTEIADMFKQANIFAARNSVLQSIAMFEEITTLYPAEYLPYLGYSIALEKAGLLNSSEEALRNAIEIIGQDAEQQDAREVFERRLSALEGKAEAVPQVISTTANETFSPRMMAYGGGYVASSFISLNAKAGVFFTEENYATIEGGMTNSGNNMYASLGMSFYDRKGIYVMGAGITTNIGTTAMFYAKISVGLSFMNKSRTSSFDIFLDGKAPLKKGYPTMMGLSIGQSFYFGNRK